MKDKLKVELDDLGLDELKAMPHEELLLIGEKKHWICQHPGCSRKTAILHFGVLPWFYWRKKWFSLERNFFLCGKHWKFYKRLGQWYIARYLMKKKVTIEL